MWTAHVKSSAPSETVACFRNVCWLRIFNITTYYCTLDTLWSLSGVSGHELEPFHWCGNRSERVRSGGGVVVGSLRDFWCKHGIHVLLVLLTSEVRLYDLHRLLVDLAVVVVLQHFDLLEAPRLLYLLRECRPQRSAGLHSRLQNVPHPIQGDGDDLGVAAVQHLAERLNDAEADDVLQLLAGGMLRRVGQHPARLPLHLVLPVTQEPHNGRDDVGFDQRLDLVHLPRRDVGHQPARLLLDGALLG
mmetsp:Transcript_4808/g.8284  ORF Transcript_4808/g.8284 Transcript_4808/m.8284 type:complete len:246 (-) Transcript_4808:1621-2358(-)